MNEEELKQKIYTLQTEGGCDRCNFQCGNWTLCLDCENRLKELQAELKGFQEGAKSEREKVLKEWKALDLRLTTYSEITFDNKSIIFPIEAYALWIQKFVDFQIKELSKLQEKGK